MARNFNPLMLHGARLKRNSLTAGIVAAWNPNVFPGGNRLYDRAGANNGTIVGATWATDPRTGLVLAYGASKYTQVSPIYNGVNAFVISAWLTGPGTAEMYFYGEGDPGATNAYICLGSDYDPTGRFRGVVQNTGERTLDFKSNSTTVYNGTLRHIVFALAGGRAKLFIDGVLDKDSAYTMVSGTLSAGVMGARYVNGSYWYNWTGTIGQTLIFARALSAAEIGLLYADPIGAIWDVGEDNWEYAPAESPAAGSVSVAIGGGLRLGGARVLVGGRLG